MNSEVRAMRKYIVTLKEHNKGHNPRNKIHGDCFASEYCTDSTGHHHSILVSAWSMNDIRDYFTKRHITRIELVGKELTQID